MRRRMAGRATRRSGERDQGNGLHSAEGKQAAHSTVKLDCAHHGWNRLKQRGREQPCPLRRVRPSILHGMGTEETSKQISPFPPLPQWPPPAGRRPPLHNGAPCGGASLHAAFPMPPITMRTTSSGAYERHPQTTIRVPRWPYCTSAAASSHLTRQHGHRHKAAPLRLSSVPLGLFTRAARC